MEKFLLISVQNFDQMIKGNKIILMGINFGAAEQRILDWKTETIE